MSDDLGGFLAGLASTTFPIISGKAASKLRLSEGKIEAKTAVLGLTKHAKRGRVLPIKARLSANSFKAHEGGDKESPDC